MDCADATISDPHRVVSYCKGVIIIIVCRSVELYQLEHRRLIYTVVILYTLYPVLLSNYWFQGFKWYCEGIRFVQYGGLHCVYKDLRRQRYYEYT